jgi:riboflavin synthase
VVRSDAPVACNASAICSVNEREWQVFSGLVEDLGQVQSVEERPPGRRFWVIAKAVAEDAKLGDSIAINGCCLTVIEKNHAVLGFDAGPETLQRTNLGDLGPGSAVNLERSLRLSDRLGGHFVTGHVDAVGTVDERLDDEEWCTLWFTCPSRLTRQMATKGSIAVDGVSLTLVEVTEDRFSVALIPHTLQVTTLGNVVVGTRVNLETDLLAKYVAQQLGRPAVDQ